MPLSVIREGRKSSARWLPSDRLLSIALTLLEQSRGSCGHYVDEAYGESGGDWKVDEVVCRACAALEKHRDGQEKPTPGAKSFAFNAHQAEFGEDELRPEFSPPASGDLPSSE